MRPARVASLIARVLIGIVIGTGAVAHAAPVYVGSVSRGAIATETRDAMAASLVRAMKRHGVRVLDTTASVDEASAKALADGQAALKEASSSYSDGDVAGALVHLDDALAAYEKGPAYDGDVKSLALFRDLQALRALCLLRQKKKAAAEQALRDLVVVQPGYRPNRDKAPPELLKVLDAVLDDVSASPPALLSVKSKPSGARVFVDGRERGRTPLALEDVPPGKHYVMVVDAGGRFTTRVDVPAAGATVEARVAGRDAALARLALTAVQEPTTAAKFVEAVSGVGDDCVVAVILPAGKKADVLAARVLNGEVIGVVGARVPNNDNARETAMYLLAGEAIDAVADKWIVVDGKGGLDKEKSAAEPTAGMRQQVFAGTGSAVVERAEIEEEAPPISPAIIAVAAVGAGVVLLVGGGAVYVVADRELKKDRGFFWKVDTSGL